jgi:hypothetical protein
MVECGKVSLLLLHEETKKGYEAGFTCRMERKGKDMI